MLVENMLKIGNVYGFKIISGEEFLATVTSITDASIEIASPSQLMQTKQGVAFGPLFMMAADTSKMPLTKSNIICFYTPDKGFIEAYTGYLNPQSIITPSKKIIV